MDPAEPFEEKERLERRSSSSSFFSSESFLEAFGNSSTLLIRWLNDADRLDKFNKAELTLYFLLA